jgi:hypothetical protein
MGYLMLFLALTARPGAQAAHHFDWGNAAIGAMIAVGVTLLLLGVALVVLQARSAGRTGPPEP